MSHHHHHEFIDLYCCLPHEFLIGYPQPRLSFNRQQKKKTIHRNKNALERTSTSSRLTKCKSKNFLHSSKPSKDHYVNDTYKSRGRKINKIMSIESSDHDVEFYMEKESIIPIRTHHSSQMADGDKKHQKILENIFNKFQKERFNEEQEPLIDMMQLVPSESSYNNQLKQLSDQLSLVEFHKNNALTNISKSNLSDALLSPEIDNIEEFQPIIEIISPSEVQSTLLNNILSSFFPTISTPIASTSSSSNINPLVLHSQQHITDHISQSSPCMLFDNTTDIAELLIIDQPPILSSSSSSSPSIDSKLIYEKQPTEKISSLSESIKDLCLLIRQLLHYELTGQKITSLQTTITNQLAILLTYFATPNNEKINSQLRTKDTIERMTSTDEDHFSFKKSLLTTVGTQTDFDWTIQLNDHISKSTIISSNNTHFSIEPLHDLVEFEVQQSLLSENKQENMMNILPLSQNVTSHTELMSTSATLHLPGHRPNHALSDTFIYHIRHHQQYSFSCHRLISSSETTIHSLIKHKSKKEKINHLIKYIQGKVQHFIELESSNTCLEASTEFTPDFLLTTINNSKHDNDDDDDDQTEQFGIDIKKQDYQTDTISLIINKNQEKLNTLSLNSTEKENYDSLELDIEQDQEEHVLFTSFDIHQSNQNLNKESIIKEDNLSMSSINEIDNLFLINSSSMSFNDDQTSLMIDHLNHRKYFCELLEPVLNTCQWQVPILPRKTNSFDLIYEKQTAKIDFKHLKIRSNSNNEINIVGKRVRIKSNSSLQTSISTRKFHFNQQHRKKLLTLNYNNNYHEYSNSKESLECSSSVIDTRLSSTSMDSLCSFDNDTLDKNNVDQYSILSQNLHRITDYPRPDERIHSTSSHFSDVNDKFDSNIALAENLLEMLNSFNNSHSSSSTTKIDILHMHIRQFLFELDAGIRLERKRRKKLKKKIHKKVNF